jgi:thiosulfate dehydrogenase (quinone) large subunit
MKALVDRGPVAKAREDVPDGSKLDLTRGGATVTVPPFDQRRSLPTWPKDALRVSFGVIWGIDAVMKWLPGFIHGYSAMITMAGKGQPGWLQPWFRFWAGPAHPTAWAYGAAVIETLIAVALVFGVALKFTYIAGGVFSLLVWGIAEGFGGPYVSGATDIGTSIIYALMFAALLALSAYVGPSRYSVDYYLEERFSWWWKLAEVRRPALLGQPIALHYEWSPSTGAEQAATTSTGAPTSTAALTPPAVQATALPERPPAPVGS